MATVETGHTQIGHHNVERFTALFRGSERIEARLAAIGQLHGMTVVFQNLLEQLAQQGFVIHEQDPQRRQWAGFGRGFKDVSPGRFAHWKHEPEGGSFAGFALDFNDAVVPLHHAIDHGQAEAGATLAFGGEKGFETALACFLIHARAAVGDFQRDAGGHPQAAAPRGPGTHARSDGDDTAAGHGVHGVEDQVGERLAQFTFGADDIRQAGVEIEFHIHGNAAPLGDVAPARAGQFNDLLGELIELHGQQRLMFLAFPVEIPHARDDVRNVVAGGLDVLQIPSAAFAEVGFVPQQQLGKAGDGREGVVDVVGDAAGQLADSAQPFVLHDGVLRLAKFVVGSLQLSVQARLMRGQSDVRAECPHKLALADAETINPDPRRDENAKQISLDNHGHDGSRAHLDFGQLPDQRGHGFANVRFVQQLAFRAGFQAGFRQRQRPTFQGNRVCRRRLAFQPRGGLAEGRRLGIEEIDRAIIDR